MEIPSGWSCKHVPKQLITTKGKIFCILTLFDRFEYELLVRQNEVREQAQDHPSNQFSYPGKWLKSAVRFGECNGYKYSYSQKAPAWKAIEYVLEVRSGFVYVRLGHENGKDFDESEIEEKLHTIRILPPS
jgi:hypothetical protein